jgi:hypothetical protein
MRALLKLRSRPPQGHVRFDMECDLVQYENKVETIVGIHLWNLLLEVNFEGVQTPSKNDHLQINVTCIGMLT